MKQKFKKNQHNVAANLPKVLGVFLNPEFQNQRLVFETDLLRIQNSREFHRSMEQPSMVSRYGFNLKIIRKISKI